MSEAQKKTITLPDGASPRIAIIGLGYVGLPLAVQFAKYYDVIGLDINETKIQELQAAHDRMGEVSSEDLRSVDIHYTSDNSRIADGDIIIIAVPTPIDEYNNPDTRILESASETVGRNISAGSVVVFESTVYPGATEDVCLPLLEQHSGLSVDNNFYLGYSPERVNPGDKEHTIDKVVKVVSSRTPEVAEYLSEVYGSIVSAGTHVTTSIRVAEAAKVIENTQRDLNIALVNELAVLFDKLDIDIHEVLDAAGTKWNFHRYTPGLVGGHCIGVDPYYLTFKAQEIGHHPEVILAGRRINDSMHEHYAQRLVKQLNASGVAASKAQVAVLGLTFKENCGDYRNSRSKQLVAELRTYGCMPVGVDPWLDDRVISSLGAKPMSLQTFSKRTWDGVIIAIPHKEFADLNLDSCGCVIDIKGFL